MHQTFPKPLPRVRDKALRKRETLSTRRDIYRQVDARDRHACRCCGRREQIEHHHRKSRGAGGEDSTANVLLLCRLCHQLCQQYRILIEGETCDGPLIFAMVPSIALVVFERRPIPPQVRIEVLPRD